MLLTPHSLLLVLAQVGSMSTISQPGPNWHMLWPTGGIENIQLDVVGFLAILGEEAVKKTSRLASLSWTFLLPRLLPAPHSLLYSERPQELDVFRASVSGVHSGNVKDHMSHVGGVILWIHPLHAFQRDRALTASSKPGPTFSVRCLQVRPEQAQHKVESALIRT